MSAASIQERFENFVAHSPAFFDDLQAENLDRKHQRIVAEAYSQFEAATGGRAGADFRSLAFYCQSE